MTEKATKGKRNKSLSIQGYDTLLSGMVSLVQEARRVSARTLNSIMTATYWEIGRRIVENEQSGRPRAGYGEALLRRMSADLTRKFGRGFSRQNLQQMRRFYRAYSPREICQTVSGKSAKRQAISARTSPKFFRALSCFSSVNYNLAELIARPEAPS